MPSDSPNDSAGNPIAVGNTVKLVGTVIAMNLLDGHFGDIQVQLSHPLAASAYNDPPIGETLGTYGGAPPVAVTVDASPSGTPGPRRIIKVPASMLTIGA